MADLVRVFLADTSQREIRESFRGFLIELWLRLFRERSAGKQNQSGEHELLHLRFGTVAQPPAISLTCGPAFFTTGRGASPKFPSVVSPHRIVPGCDSDFAGRGETR